MTDRTINKTLAANAGLILAAVLWGTSFPFVKIALGSVPPIYIIAVRFTIASLVLGAIYFKRLKNITPRLFWSSLVVSLALFGGNMLQTIGCDYTTAGKTAFITTLYVVLTPFVCRLFYGTRAGALSIIAAVVALAGIGVLSLGDDLSVNFGDMLVFLCGILYAVHMALLSKAAETEDTALLAVMQIAFNALFAWMLAPLFHGRLDLAVFDLRLLSIFVYLAMFCTLSAFLLQNLCIKYTTASTAALLCALESVFGAVFSIIILRERPEPRMYLGFALVFVAIVIATVGPDIIAKRKLRQTENPSDTGRPS